MNKQKVLMYLPAYAGNELPIEDEQTVHDIVIEVLAAHEEFTGHYDKIALLFDGNNVDKVTRKLFDFCKENIFYQIEPEDDQTTRSPAAILSIGHGDCKHYAGFIGGVLDALCRKGKKIDWTYRFASYDLLNDEPGHVFVVINDNGNEIWIDPVLDYYNERLEPCYITDKKPTGMLSRISGFQYSSNLDLLPEGLLANYRSIAGPYWQLKPELKSTGADGINANPYFTDGLFLGLEHYGEDGYSVTGTDWTQLAIEINDLVTKGPSPGHKYNGDFVRWIYETNNKGWNFYYPHGVMPGYNPTNSLPANFPRPVITADKRLVFDRDGVIEYWKNNEVHAVNMWVQDILNTYGDSHIMQPKSLKEFTTGKFGDRNTYNMFTEYRGSSIFEDVGKALEDAVNFVKEGVLKIVGSIPRNAFLALIGINAFGWATKMKRHIDAGESEEMAKKWETLGGNPDKLFNTIEDGAKKQAILGAAIGVAETATWMVAAAPIIAILLKFLDKDGKATEILNAAIPQLQEQFPDIDFTPLRDALPAKVKKTGQPVTWTVDDRDNENLGGGSNDMPGGFMQWIKDNPLLAAGIAGGIVYVATSKTKTKKVTGMNKIVLPLIVAAGIFFLSKSGNSADDQKRNVVKQSVSNDTEFLNAIAQMSNREIDILYDVIMAGNNLTEAQKQAARDVLARYGLEAT